jgi:hypothetical protein
MIREVVAGQAPAMVYGGLQLSKKKCNHKKRKTHKSLL